MRTVLVALATALALLVASPALAAEEVPPAVDALARLDGLPFIAEAISDGTPGTLGLGDLHAVHHFSTAWVQGATGATVTAPTDEWVATWTDDGLPAGVLRIELADGAPVLAGVVEDPHLAGALMGWDGQGQLVEEQDRARWFALQGTTLLTLTAPSGSTLETTYPVLDYATDLREHRAGDSGLVPTLLAPADSGGLSALVALALAAGAAAAAVAAQRRMASRRRPRAGAESRAT